MMSLRQLGLRVLLWLPLCFAAWYYFSILFVPPIGFALDAVLSYALPTVPTEVGAYGTRLHINVGPLPALTDIKASQSEVAFYLHPLDYCYGIVLFTALSLSVCASVNERAFNWLVGAGLLFVLATIGVASQAFKIIVFDIVPQTDTNIGWTVIHYYALGFLYKFMFLIVTPFAPVMLWLWQYRVRFLSKLSNHPR